jgi:hypothetical protein
MKEEEAREISALMEEWDRLRDFTRKPDDFIDVHWTLQPGKLKLPSAPVLDIVYRLMDDLERKLDELGVELGPRKR